LGNIQKQINGNDSEEEDDNNNSFNFQQYFPIKNSTKLQEIDRKAEEKEFKKALCKYLRKLRPINNAFSNKHLSRIISDKCLIECNWTKK